MFMPIAAAKSSNMTHSTKDKKHISLVSLLSSYNTIFFETLAGNNGDRLIQEGATLLLDESGCQLADSPDAADMIFINGGGAMNDMWQGGLEKLQYYASKYPRTPIVVGPSSFYLQTSTLDDILGKRVASTTIFCRDQKSMEILESEGSSNETILFGERDLAFNIDFSHLLTKYNGTGHARDKLLIAMRVDRESNSETPLQKLRAPWLPPSIRRPLARLKSRLIANASGSVLESAIVEFTSSEEIGENLSRYYCDVSTSMSFEDFVHTVASARAVITDRLHVAILSHISKTKCLLLPGAYHKNQSVFEYSLASSKYVKFRSI